jgi:hypothetical protein
MAIKVSALNVLYKFELHRLQEQGSYSLDDAPLVVIDLWQKWELAATSTGVSVSMLTTRVVHCICALLC